MKAERPGRMIAAFAALLVAAACAADPTEPADAALAAAPPVSGGGSGDVVIVPTATPNLFTQGWFGYGDRAAAAGLASIGTAPATQTLGIGSLNLANTAHGWEVAAYGNPSVPPGTPLSDITALSYATYTPSGQAGITVQHVSLQFTVDYDVTDASEQFQGRLVYEPYNCNTVAQNVWTTWNTLDGANTGCWWQTANPAGASAPRVGDVAQAGPLPCPIGNPCTWAEVIATYPNAGFHATNGAAGLILKVGSAWTGTFYTDALVVGVGGTSTTYDFEPYDVATSKNECMSNGWKNVTRADGSTFKNQGDCVSYTVNGK